MVLFPTCIARMAICSVLQSHSQQVWFLADKGVHELSCRYWRWCTLAMTTWSLSTTRTVQWSSNTLTGPESPQWCRTSAQLLTPPMHRKQVRTRSSATAEGPRDALCQLKSCQLLQSCTTNHCWKAYSRNDLAGISPPHGCFSVHRSTPKLPVPWGKGRIGRKSIYIAPFILRIVSKRSDIGSHSFICKLHHACISFVNVFTRWRHP